MVPIEATPPVRFLRIPHLGIDFGAADATLADQLAVFVGQDVARDLLDDEDERDGRPAEAVDVADVPVLVERGDGEVEGDGELISDDNEGQRQD